ncbi:MAG: hypothetical protein KAU41_00110 [Deltaproteobacteria bacterium]|nr:hypothetical protein [Deltaproteobacteria bacterium]
MLDLDKSKKARLRHETKHSSYSNMAMGVWRKEGRLKPRDELAEKDDSANLTIKDVDAEATC